MVRPVPHSAELSVPVFESMLQVDSLSIEEELGWTHNEIIPLLQKIILLHLHYLHNSLPSKVNDFARDVNLSGISEFFAYSLKKKIFLQTGSAITFHREWWIHAICTQENDIVYCNNVECLLKKLGVSEYGPEYERLLIWQLETKFDIFSSA